MCIYIFKIPCPLNNNDIKIKSLFEKYVDKEHLFRDFLVIQTFSLPSFKYCNYTNKPFEF